MLCYKSMELIFNILQEDENDKPSSDIIFIWTKFFFTFFLYFLFLFISLIKTVLNFFFILSIFLIIHISNEQI